MGKCRLKKFRIKTLFLQCAVKDLLEEVRRFDSYMFDKIGNDKIKAEIYDTIPCLSRANKILTKISRRNDRMDHTHSIK